MTLHPSRPVYVVDWDGTCVEEVWPGMGGWLPGAVESLRYLSSRGKTVIYSLRCHRYECDDRTLRDPWMVRSEELAIRRMLDDEGLHDIEIYPADRGKPPGRFYIDDRAVRFDGDWMRALGEISLREAAR